MKVIYNTLDSVVETLAPFEDYIEVLPNPAPTPEAPVGGDDGEQGPPTGGTSIPDGGGANVSAGGGEEGAQAIGGDEGAQATGGDEGAQPTGGDDVAQPAGGDDVAQPAGGDDVAQPAGGEDVAQPAAGGDERAQPAAGGDDVAQPTGGDEAAQPVGGEVALQAEGGDEAGSGVDSLESVPLGGVAESPIGGAPQSADGLEIAPREQQEVWTETVKLVPNDGAELDHFGRSVALDEDLAIVGAWADDDGAEDSGSAYLFGRDENGEWRQLQKLTASAPSDSAYFSWDAVALSESQAMVGAPWSDALGPENGAVYVFERGLDQVWQETQRLIPLPPDLGGAPMDVHNYGLFGSSIAVGDGEAIIGAPRDSEQAERAGAVYVFSPDVNGAWQQSQKLMASDGGINGSFGFRVALCGNILIVGADEANADDGEGSVYVFTRNDDGQWFESEKILLPWGDAGPASSEDPPILSLTCAGDMAMVGVRSLGEVHVFSTGEGNQWQRRQTLVVNDLVGMDRFGVSLAMTEGVALVGASRDQVNGDGSGSVYVFIRDGHGMWIQRRKLSASDGEPGDEFGHSVAIHGETIIVGAHQQGERGRSSGSAYVFTLGELWADCGNQRVDTGEECDDGNRESGDGCSPLCMRDGAISDARMSGGTDSGGRDGGGGHGGDAIDDVGGSGDGDLTQQSSDECNLYLPDADGQVFGSDCLEQPCVIGSYQELSNFLNQRLADIDGELVIAIPSDTLPEALITAPEPWCLALPDLERIDALTISGLSAGRLRLDRLRSVSNLKLVSTSLTTVDVSSTQHEGSEGRAQVFEFRDNPNLESVFLGRPGSREAPSPLPADALDDGEYIYVFRDNPQLSNIEVPFPQRVAGIFVINNPSLSALPVADIVSLGRLEVVGNQALQSLSFDRLETVSEGHTIPVGTHSGIKIAANGGLESVNFNRLRALTTLYIKNENRLADLLVDALEHVEEDFSLDNLPNLVALGLPALQTVKGAMGFEKTGLAQIHLPELSRIDDLGVGHNRALVAFKAPKVLGVDGSLDIRNNPILEDVQLTELVSASNLVIESNGPIVEEPGRPASFQIDLESLYTVTGLFSVLENAATCNFGRGCIGEEASMGCACGADDGDDGCLWDMDGEHRVAQTKAARGCATSCPLGASSTIIEQAEDFGSISALTALTGARDEFLVLGDGVLSWLASDASGPQAQLIARDSIAIAQELGPGIQLLHDEWSETVFVFSGDQVEGIQMVEDGFVQNLVEDGSSVARVSSPEDGESSARIVAGAIRRTWSNDEGNDLAFSTLILGINEGNRRRVVAWSGNDGLTGEHVLMDFIIPSEMPEPPGIAAVHSAPVRGRTANGSDDVVVVFRDGTFALFASRDDCQSPGRCFELFQTSNTGQSLPNIKLLSHLADVTGDGRADLLVADRGTGAISIYPSLGAGGLSPEVTEMQERRDLGGIIDMKVGDADGDGFNDIILLNSTVALSADVSDGGGFITILKGGANGFAPQTRPWVTTEPMRPRFDWSQSSPDQIFSSRAQLYLGPGQFAASTQAQVLEVFEGQLIRQFVGCEVCEEGFTGETCTTPVVNP